MADQARGLLSPYLRDRRINVAVAYLDGRVLDYGCGTGALADFFPPDRYVGTDRDEASLEIARQQHPGYSFYPPEEIHSLRIRFDSIAALAVLEHLPDRVEFLRLLGSLLSESGRLVLTTPHPLSNGIHFIGSRLGIFSREASEEHGSLVGSGEMAGLAWAAGLAVIVSKRFLLGMNQLFVLERS